MSQICFLKTRADVLWFSYMQIDSKTPHEKLYLMSMNAVQRNQEFCLHFLKKIFCTSPTAACPLN